MTSRMFTNASCENGVPDGGVYAVALPKCVPDPSTGSWQSSKTGILQHSGYALCGGGLWCIGSRLLYFRGVFAAPSVGCFVRHLPPSVQEHVDMACTRLVEKTPYIGYVRLFWNAYCGKYVAIKLELMCYVVNDCSLLSTWLKRNDSLIKFDFLQIGIEFGILPIYPMSISRIMQGNVI